MIRTPPALEGSPRAAFDAALAEFTMAVTALPAGRRRDAAYDRLLGIQADAYAALAFDTEQDAHAI